MFKDNNSHLKHTERLREDEIFNCQVYIVNEFKVNGLNAFYNVCKYLMQAIEDSENC